MKTNRSSPQHSKRFIHTLLFSILFSTVAGQAFAGEHLEPLIFPRERAHVKVYGERSHCKVKLYAGLPNELHFAASDAGDKLYQLFLFDLSGKLVCQSEIRNSERTTLQLPEKGHYLFEVLSEDERVQHGTVIMR